MISAPKFACSMFLLLACGAPPAVVEPARTPTPAPAPARGPELFTLTLLGTNDFHGHVEAMPLLAGYVEMLRAMRAEPGNEHGAVVLLDGGDMFQGTLESNQDEGLPVVELYNALGYDAAALGNHEFDYGPLGPKGTPEDPADDPFGALRRNIDAATFPLVTANLHGKSGAPFPLAKVVPSVVRSIPWGADVLRVGVVGGSTKDTLRTTIASNVRSLDVSRIAVDAAPQVSALRNAGADLVFLAMHAGGKCRHPQGRDAQADGCDSRDEVDDVVRGLGSVKVDGIVAGHTHAAVASLFDGTPVIESHSYGRAFGRIDYRLERDAQRRVRVVNVRVHPPRLLCEKLEDDTRTCTPSAYEGRVVARTKNPKIVDVVDRAIEKARVRKAESLGVTLSEPFKRDHNDESALGNLFADLLLSHYQKVLAKRGDLVTPVAMMNGGGLRQNLPKGPLAYGSLFEASPFDNRLFMARTTAGQLLQILTRSVLRKGGFLSIAGVTARIVTDKSQTGELRDAQDRVLRPDAPILIIASDFLLTGGDDFWGKEESPAPMQESTVLVRDAFELEIRRLATAGVPLDPARYLDRARPRVTIAR
jgi:2',3'-cyclic-nucleotide 2'-phosphodiesterase (5'-nucleotidase family)